MPTLKVDGVEVTVPAGTSILEAAKTAGIEIPHYCYHPGLSVAGQCRMCQVDVEKMPKLAIACNTPVAEGMVVSTRSPRVEKARRAVLEFYLVNHPLDCPICDKGGECPLQDYTLKYGPGESRSAEEKFHRAKHRVLGPHIVFDTERCILCTRCIRFCREIPGTGELGVFSRGERSEINVFPGRSLDNAYSGNVIDLCPVGALTSREYRFQSRPWDLVQRTESVCPLCSQGCNIFLDVRHGQTGEKLLRIRPRENQQVNRWWMCDEGRFTFQYFADPARLRAPRWREDGASVDITYEEALRRVADVLRRTIHTAGPSAIGCIASSRLTNEELFLTRRFFREIVGTPHLDYRVRSVQLQETDAREDALLRRTDKTANSRGARDLEILPGPEGLGVRGMIAAAADGRLHALVVLEEDLVRELPDHSVRPALDRLDLLVVFSMFDNETTAPAHILFPSFGFAEKEGSFTNFQGRLQRLHRALTPHLAMRGLPEVLRDLTQEMGGDLGAIDPEQIWAAIGEMPGPYHGIAWKDIGPLGLLPGESRGAPSA